MNEVYRAATVEGLRLYERYGKPLENEHRGEYVAIAPDGRTVLAPTLLEVVQRATTVLGPGNHAFKVGERTIGTWP